MKYEKNYEGDTCDFCGAHGAALIKCSNCKVAKYCGLSCQKSHYEEHKAACRALSKWISGW